MPIAVRTPYGHCFNQKRLIVFSLVLLQTADDGPRDQTSAQEVGQYCCSRINTTTTLTYAQFNSIITK